MLGFGTPALWKFLSEFGSAAAMSALCIAMMVALLLQRRPITALACLLIEGGGGLLDQGLKELIKRPRPPGAFDILHRHSWSFPSGHSMGSMVGYGMLTLLVWRCWNLSRRVRMRVAIVSALMILIVGTSRVGLGVHYPTDVLGGYGIGALWLVIGFAVLQRIAPQELLTAPAASPAPRVNPATE